jgi:hypothetical protein
MVDYTIAARPTLYQGRRYRSRLEARWAAFFDLLGWQHEYEPVDMGLWSPDFVLRNGEDPPQRVLVEIKPIDEFDRETSTKMEAVWDGGDTALLLCPVAPRLVGSVVMIGWQISDLSCDNGWRDAPLCWIPHSGHPGFYADIPSPAFHGGMWRGLCFGDAFDVERHQVPHFYPDYTMELWARATNAVQWERGR